VTLSLCRDTQLVKSCMPGALPVAGVRLVHIPTGLAVKCTEHRMQQQNRATAMERLTAKLLVVLEEQQAAALADIRGDVVKAEWGQQIRNYVFHPYKLVKDTRTGGLWRHRHVVSHSLAAKYTASVTYLVL